MPLLTRNPSGGAAAVDIRAKNANDSKKITKKTTKENREKTPTTTQAPAKSAKKKTKGLWWTDMETNNLLDIIQHKKPSGGYMWDQVCETYNSKQERDLRGLSAMPYRDVDAIRTKWKSLKSCKKNTGDPTCPPTSSERRESLVKLRMDLLFLNLAVKIQVQAVIPKMMMKNLLMMMVLLVLIVTAAVTHPQFFPLLFYRVLQLYLKVFFQLRQLPQ